MSDGKPVRSPLQTDIGIIHKPNPLCDEGRTKYGSIVGSLLYLATKTRPDLCVVASALCSHVESPTDKQMGAVKHALRYFKGSAQYELILCPGTLNQLIAYVDASWGREAGTGRNSRSRIMIKYDIAPIFLTSWLQKSVSLRTTEGEYMALSNAGPYIVWFRNVLNELDIAQRSTIVHQNNMGAIEWVIRGPAKHMSQRKYVDIRHNYVIDLARLETIDIVMTPTADMEANVLTKALHSAGFEREIRRARLFSQK